MRINRQLTVSALIVVAATGAVLFNLRGGGLGDGEEEAGGHNMATMGAAGDEKMPVVLDADAARRIGVVLTPVEFRPLLGSIQAVGTVVYDETRLATVNPKTEGWVEHLYVDFTGAPVRKGEPLLEVYSPALVSAQEELILAHRLVRGATAGRALRNAQELLASARRRLAYWDVSEDEIREIEERDEPAKTITLRSPADGIVVEKNIVQGDRIVAGMTLYRIADLSRVWIEAEVFEKDVALVRVGQQATVSFEAYPGRVFTGRITYAYPTMSMQSRTARVRLELPNSDLGLKPGMYAQIALESLESEPTLVLPRSAVIATGERTLVFVQGDSGELLPREVIPGRTSGQFIQILSGVNVGELVVSSAAFLVDAESNLGTMTGDMDENLNADGEDVRDDSRMDMGPTGTDAETMPMPDSARQEDGQVNDRGTDREI